MVPDRQKVRRDGWNVRGQNYIPPTLSREKSKCVSGNRPENFRYSRHSYYFSGKKLNFMDFERQNAFKKMHKIFFFSRKPEKILGFTSKFK